MKPRRHGDTEALSSNSAPAQSDDSASVPPCLRGETVSVCPTCGCRDLFIRKDFPQKIGLSIVIIAAITFLALASSRQYFYLGAGVLVVAAIIDSALYWFVPKITVCYRCRAEFRDAPLNPDHHGFELATAEKYRGKDSPS